MIMHRFHRHRVRAAAAGELSGKSELRVRKHIRRCAACRAEYDRLSLTLTAAGGPAQQEKREAARLRVSLDDLAATITRPQRRNHYAWAAALSLAAATGLLLWVWPMQMQDTKPAEVVWRGPASPASPKQASPFVLLLYASAIGSEGQPGPARLVGELPISQGVKLEVGSYLQLGYRNGVAARHLVATLRDAAGSVHFLTPQEGGAELIADADEHILSTSVSLANKVAPGRAFVCVWLGDEAPHPNLYQRLSDGYCPREQGDSRAAGGGFIADLTLVP